MPCAPSVLPPSLPPVGINREQAAAFIGVSPTNFDAMVQGGRMPQPRIPSKGRIVWDVEGVQKGRRINWL